MKHLCDSNVFIALSIGLHMHHLVAARWFENLTDADTVLFCRATRISFLRLLTQKIAPDFVPLSNREAWAALDMIMTDEAVGFEAEPEGLEDVWRELSQSDASSPKLWMDAYLAAFAISAGMRLVTLDRDFLKFRSQGLDVLLLVK